MKVRIRVVNAVAKGVLDDSILPAVPEFVKLECDWLDEGPTSIECRVDDSMAVPHILKKVRQAADDRVDGILVNCFMDPGVEAARELVRVPVVGAAQPAMALACTLGQRFSVILPAKSGIPIVREQAARYGVAHALASVRSVEMPVAELSDHDRLARELAREAEKAVRDDDAHVIVLGCTGMAYITARFALAIADSGVDVPVLDPTLAGIGWLVAVNTLGTTHSERTYSLPPWRTTREREVSGEPDR